MKRYFIILFLSLSAVFTCSAQEDTDERGGKLLEKMQQYIQKKLNLTKSESERFSPIFLRYIVELRRTHREFKGDGPMRQLKVAELRVKFRNEFRGVMDEQRANRVYEFQREFEDKVRDEIRNRRLENRTGPRRTRALAI
jgi:hypothetical protein